MSSQNTLYRELLKRELAARCERNPKYSLRAFARDLDFLPSRLSDILNDRQGLSLDTALHLAKRLGLSASERNRFTTSVEASHSRSHKKREAARAQMEREETNSDYRGLQEDNFAVIADWYHFAILELTLLPDFVPSNEWVAKRLGIPTFVAEMAISRLEKVGLITRTKKGWTATTTFPATTHDVPSEAVKRNHTQMLEKAAAALYLQSVEQRDFSSITFAINPDDLPEIKSEIKRFRRKLEKKYKSNPRKREVYCLSTQLFSLTQGHPVTTANRSH